MQGNSAGFQDAVNLLENFMLVGGMFQDADANDRIELVIWKWQPIWIDRDLEQTMRHRRFAPAFNGVTAISVVEKFAQPLDEAPRTATKIEDLEASGIALAAESLDGTINKPEVRTAIGRNRRHSPSPTIVYTRD